MKYEKKHLKTEALLESHANSTYTPCVVKKVLQLWTKRIDNINHNNLRNHMCRNKELIQVKARR